MPPGNTVRRLQYLVDVDDRATRKLMQIDAVADEMGGDLEATAAQLDLIGTALKGVGAAAVGASAAVAALAWQGSKLSKPMSIIQSTTNASAETMNNLRNEIQRIGAETPVTVKQAADAFKELSYAGLETNQIFEAGQDVVELAVAGNLQMGESAKIAAQNMNAFNLEANQVSSVADTLAATFASSATEIQELANGLSYVNATASQLGFSMTETTATLGTLADNAIAGTRAGTSLNQAFAKLFAQTGKVKRSLDAVGLSIQDFIDKDGETKDMLEIFETLKTRLDELNLSDAGRTAFLTDVFGRRGARAIQPILSSLDNLREKQQQASFAQFKSQLADVRDMTSEEVIDLEQALFGDQDGELDILGMAPTQDDVFSALRERYGAGGGAAQQVQAALENAFPDMEDFAIEQVAETLTATGDEISDAQIEDAFEETEKSAAQLRQELTDTELAMAVAKDTFREATTDAEIYREYIDSVGGALKYIKGSLSVVADEMFLGLRPALMAVLKSGMKFLDWLRNQPELLQSMGRALGVVAVGASAAAAALGSLYAVVSVKLLLKAHGAMWSMATSGGMLAGVFGKLVTAGTKAQWVLSNLSAVLIGLKDIGIISMSIWFREIAAALGKTVTTARNASGVLATLSKGAGGLAATIWRALGPIRVLASFLGGPLTAALALAGSALAFWITDFNNFREKVKPFTNALAGAVDGIINFGTAVMDVVGWAVGGLADHLGGPATGALELFADVLARVLSEFGLIIKFVSRALHYMGRLVDIVGTNVWDAFMTDLSGVQAALNIVVGFLDTILNALGEIASGNPLSIDINWPEPPDWLKGLLNPGEGSEYGGGGDGGDYTLGGGTPGAAGHGQTGVSDEQARKSGRGQQEAYAKGLKEGRKNVTREQRKTAAEQSAFMPSSNAKKGPLSNLTTRGSALLETYAKGMRRARGTATTAAKNSMGKIAQKLGPDGIREKGDSTFKKLADQIERIHGPLEDGNDLLDTALETVEDLLGRLRQFRNFRLNLSNIAGPLDLVKGILGKGVEAADSLTNWIMGLDLMDPSFEGIISTLEDVYGWFDDIISKAGDARDEVNDSGDGFTEGGDVNLLTQSDDGKIQFGDEDNDFTLDENPPSYTGENEDRDGKNTDDGGGGGGGGGGDGDDGGGDDDQQDDKSDDSSDDDQQDDGGDSSRSTPSVGSLLEDLVPETEPAEESKFGDEDEDYTVDTDMPSATGQDQNTTNDDEDDDDEDDDDEDGNDGGAGRSLGTGGMGLGRFASAGLPAEAKPQDGQQGQTATDRVMQAARHAMRGPRPVSGGEGQGTTSGGQQTGQQAAGGARGTEGSQTGRKARYRQQAAQRAQQTAQPFMPRAYNAFRSGIIPSFVPTLGDSSGGGGGTGDNNTGGGPTGGGADTPQGSDDGQQGDGSGDGEGGDGGDTPEGSDDGTESGASGPEEPTASSLGTASASPNVTIEDNREVNIDNSGGDTAQLREELLREMRANDERLVDDIIQTLQADSGSGGTI